MREATSIDSAQWLQETVMDHVRRARFAYALVGAVARSDTSKSCSIGECDAQLGFLVFATVGVVVFDPRDESAADGFWTYRLGYGIYACTKD